MNVLMRTLSNIGTAAAALTVMSVGARAADVPRPHYKAAPRSVIYNWAGMYAGIYAGYGWGTSNWTSPAVTTDPSGFLVGGTLGYNWQTGSFVYGLEVDLAWSTMKDDVACGVATCETANNWLGTGRVRVGYALDRFLPYLTGGIAYGDIEATNTNPLRGSVSEANFGWALGGGLEYAFLNSWTAKLEYLYVDLGNINCGAACALSTGTVDFNAHVFRLGLNYRFTGY